MPRLYFLIAICLLSCGQEKLKRQKAETFKSDKLDRNVTSASQIKDTFHWNWTRRRRNIFLPVSRANFVVKGQETIDTLQGDLNEDDIQDLVIVTGTPKEDSLQFSKYDLSRQLLVFLGRKDGGYRFAFRNEKAIPCINCCGMTDPYAGISVTKGQLIINEYCASNWKSISEHRFRYVPKKNDWLLDTVVTESYSFHYENYGLDTTTKKDFGNISLKTFVMYKSED